MRYANYGPIELSVGEDGRLGNISLKRFRRDAEEIASGLPNACGCYVFALSVSGTPIPRPWYVGKAERQTFAQECFTPHKLAIMHRVLALYSRRKPLLYLYARITERGNFSRPTKFVHRDVGYLEKMLISAGLDRNPHLENIRETGLLRDMVVPGLLNSPPGKPARATLRAKHMMGY